MTRALPRPLRAPRQSRTAASPANSARAVASQPGSIWTKQPWPLGCGHGHPVPAVAGRHTDLRLHHGLSPAGNGQAPAGAGRLTPPPSPRRTLHSRAPEHDRAQATCRLPMRNDLPFAPPPPFQAARIWAKADMLATLAYGRLDLMRSQRRADGKRQYLRIRIQPAELAKVEACIRVALGLR